MNLWDAHETLLMDSMSEGEANEIAWWLNSGPALLDAAQSAQERAEAAESKAEGLDSSQRVAVERWTAARAENAALREALRSIEGRALGEVCYGAGAPDCDNHMCAVFHIVLDTARAALSAGEGTA